MMLRLTAACSMLGFLAATGAVAHGQDVLAPDSQARKPLMSVLDRAGIGDNLDQAGIEVFGHVEGGWTISESYPPDDVITGRLFDLENNDPNLHQLQFTVERELDYARGVFDLGGRIDLLYGSDARFTQSNGMFDDDGYDDGPDNQFDIPQAYLDFALPYSTGIRVRVGKWYTLGGYEVVDPTGNAFFSRGFIFNYCLPFSHTGVLVSYVLSEGLAADLGVSRGWDQAFEDNNDALDVVGRLSWTPNTERYDAFLTGYFGPQQEDEDSENRIVIDLVFTYEAADNVSLAANVNYGYDAGHIVEPAAPFGAVEPERADAQWIAAEFWGVLAFSERLSFNSRVGWLNDDEGGSRGFGCDVYNVTLGLGITPFPNSTLGQGLLIRPEVRYDYAEERVLDSGTDHNQGTFGIDVVYAF